MSAAMSDAEIPGGQRARAQEFVDRGWFPFPVEYGGKRPGVGIKWGTATASVPHAKTLDLWFGRDAMNIGIAAKPSGLVILDEDVLGAMIRLCEAYGQPVPMTYRVRTAKGWHWYFDAPEGIEIGNSPGPLKDFGFDVRGGRGDGGYVVGAGSLHESGHVYFAEDDDQDTMELPWWITELLVGVSSPQADDPRSAERSEVPASGGSGLFDERRQFTYSEAVEFVRPFREALAAAGRGEINEALNRCARVVAHFGDEFWTRPEATRRLMELQLREWHDDDESGARATIASAYASQARDEASGAVGHDGQPLGWRAELVERRDPFGEGEEEDDDTVGDDGLTAVERVRARKVAEELERLHVREEAARMFRLEQRAERPSIAEGVIDDLDSIEPPAMLMAGLIPDLCVGWLAGRSGAYKSFLATAWGCCIATGEPWLGKPEFAVRRTLKVLYVAAEGAAGAAGRIRAWEQANGVSRLGKLLLYPRPVHLNDQGRAEELAEFVASQGIEFLIIDTFRRSAPGVEDNSTTEVGLIFEAVAKIRDDHGCGVLMLDHTGHAGERLRGASGKGDDGDYVLKAGYEGESRAAHVQRHLSVLKLKDWESDATWPIVLDEVDGQHFPVVILGEVQSARRDPDDWTDQLEWPLPADVQTLTPKADSQGKVRGREAIPPLAMFMRMQAPAGSVGISRAEATKAVRASTGMGDRVVHNAWSALIEGGRLSAALGQKALTGRHVWVRLDDDPEPVSGSLSELRSGLFS